MTPAAAATLQPETEAIAERKVADIDPRDVKINLDGQCWRQVFVRLPKGMILADLGSPDIWRRVQGNPRISLRKMDEVRMYEFDEAWFVDATVSFADMSKAVLTTPKKTDLSVRYEELPGDDNYQTRWNGGVYEGVRKRDGAVVFREATMRGAERALRQQYPLPI